MDASIPASPQSSTDFVSIKAGRIDFCTAGVTPTKESYEM